MDIIEKSKEIEKLISEYSKTTERQMEKFSAESEEYEDVKRKIDSVYLPEIRKKLQEAINIINSPVAVGLIGRYSHGKTALLNRMFNIPEEYSLPEGEGVVTSKITRVDFHSDLPFPKAFIKYRTGEEEEITIERLQKSVGTGSSSEFQDASTIDYFHLKLPVKEQFSILFAKNNISLIDMPGIGGKYFHDTVLTRNYLENTDFLIVVIKITEIDKASKALNPILSGLKGVPVIPVYTFFDIVNESVLYSDCQDEEDIIVKARELTREHIPEIARWADRYGILVSNKDGTNIESLRELILNFVEQRQYAIDKIKEEIPPLYKKKINYLIKALNNVSISANKFVEDIAKSVEMSKPAEEKKGIVKSFKKSMRHELKDLRSALKEEIRNIKGEVDNRITDLQLANNPSDFRRYLGEIISELGNYSDRLQRIVQKEIFDVKEFLKQQIEDYVSEKVNLTNEKRKEILERVSDVIEEFDPVIEVIDNLSDIGLENEMDFSVAVIRDKSSQIVDNLRNPQMMAASGASLGLIILGGMIPKVGKFLVLIGLIGLIATIASMLFLTPSTSKHFNREKNEKVRRIKKLISSTFQNLTESIVDEVKREIERLQEEVSEVILEYTDITMRDYKKNVKIINRLRNVTENLNKEISIFTESLSVEIS